MRCSVCQTPISRRQFLREGICKACKEGRNTAKWDLPIQIDEKVLYENDDGIWF